MRAFRLRLTIRTMMLCTAVAAFVLACVVVPYQNSERYRLLLLAARCSDSGKDYLLTSVTAERDALKEPDLAKALNLRLAAVTSRKRAAYMFTRSHLYWRGAECLWPTPPGPD